jgi:leucyl/phenylalanyl-tRNA--protein transferase
MLPGATLTIRVDTAFSAVMDACSAPRRGQPGTWISPQIKHAYDEWHHLGAAHSVETWQNGRLVGGLYGVSLGGMFFGESMFARVPDASKLALAWLVQFLKRHGVNNIDCQQETPHLATLGARPVPRAEFIQRVERAQRLPEPPWNKGQLLYNGTFAPGIRVQP